MAEYEQLRLPVLTQEEREAAAQWLLDNQPNFAHTTDVTGYQEAVYTLRYA